MADENHGEEGECPICRSWKPLFPSPYAIIYTCYQCRGRKSITRFLKDRGERINRVFGGENRG